jgi:hypothetical protein
MEKPFLFYRDLRPLEVDVGQNEDMKVQVQAQLLDLNLGILHDHDTRLAEYPVSSVKYLGCKSRLLDKCHKVNCLLIDISSSLEVGGNQLLQMSGFSYSHRCHIEFGVFRHMFWIKQRDSAPYCPSQSITTLPVMHEAVVLGPEAANMCRSLPGKHKP